MTRRATVKGPGRSRLVRVLVRIVLVRPARGLRALEAGQRISVRVRVLSARRIWPLHATHAATHKAARKKALQGPNALSPPPRRSQLRILSDQLGSTPVVMLGASAALSACTGGFGDAVAILVVIGINAAIGYVTESGAERTIAALTRAPDGMVTLRRAGVVQDVPIEEVTIGDRLVLVADTFVAADARLIEADALTVDQSTLTGESMPAAKSAHATDDQLPLAERSSMVYRGTIVTGGSGLGEVTAVGDTTEVGQIQRLASALQTRKTPMQQQLDELGRQVAIGAGVACAATLCVGVLRGQALLPMFRTAISLAVAAVPEGLPTVAITTLALGLNRLRARRILVRQLGAVETLGAVQVVCFDKTGTLTVNRMTVVAGEAGGRMLAVAGGVFTDIRGERLPPQTPDLAALLRVAVLCSEAELDTADGTPVLRGSPTEAALVQVALDAGIDVRALRARHPRLDMQRRAEARAYMCTLHSTKAGRLLAVKGGPTEVLGLCSHELRGGRLHPLGVGERHALERANARMADRALRVLGLAYLECDPGGSGPALEACEPPASGLIWAGLLAMADPPREDLPQLLASFRSAGVRTLMVTGDQTATAQAIGRQIGLSGNGEIESVDATQLDGVGSKELDQLVQRAHVFSRVSPAHKLQIVQALQRAGQVVAMTGDGVNDGPALKAADLGVAMGGAGPTAAREVAHVVLEDDDLGRLLNGIEHGRAIYDDVRKATHFILATNLGEILYTFVCAAGAGMPLSPMQLLWINLLTDIAPEIALAMEPPESDVLQRPPRDSAQPMFAGRDFRRIGLEGALITAAALAAHGWAQRRYGLCPRSGSVGFTALTLGQLLHGLSVRSETETLFDASRLPHGRGLPIALGGMAALQVAANFAPAARALLGTERLSVRDWSAVLLAAGTPFLVNEAIKLARRTGAAQDSGSGGSRTAAQSITRKA